MCVQGCGDDQLWAVVVDGWLVLVARYHPHRLHPLPPIPPPCVVPLSTCSQLLGKLLADLASMREESVQTAGLQHADDSSQVSPEGRWIGFRGGSRERKRVLALSGYQAD